SERKSLISDITFDVRGELRGKVRTTSHGADLLGQSCTFSKRFSSDADLRSSPRGARSDRELLGRVVCRRTRLAAARRSCRLRGSSAALTAAFPIRKYMIASRGTNIPFDCCFRYSSSTRSAHFA